LRLKPKLAEAQGIARLSRSPATTAMLLSILYSPRL